MSSITEIGAAEGTEPDTVLPAKSTLSVIMPAYNEVATVAEILRRVLLQPVVSEIVLVDDGSTDGTWEAVQRFAASLPSANRDRLVLLQHDKNRGKGRAIRTALEQVSGTHVLIQDADLEYDPADIPKLWQVMNSGAADVVFGSRYMVNSKLQSGRFVLQSGVRLLNWVTVFLYRVRLTDQATCYKLCRVADLRDMELQCERFEFCSEITAKAVRRGLAIQECSISYSPRTKAEGKKLRLFDGWCAFCALLGGAMSGRGGNQARKSFDSQRVVANSGAYSKGSVIKVGAVEKQPRDDKLCTDESTELHQQSVAQMVTKSVLAAAVMIIALCSTAVICFGGVRAAISRWNGFPVHFDSKSLVVNLKSGESATLSFPVRSLISKPVTIVGATTGCSCVSVHGLPMEVTDAGQSLRVKYNAAGTTAPESDRQYIQLWLNVDSPPIMLDVEAHVSP